MVKRMRILLPFILVFALIAGAGLFKVWADPPIETTREFNKKIKVKFDQVTGSPVEVRFVVGTDEYGNPIYGDPIDPKRAWICSYNCDDDSNTPLIPDCPDSFPLSFTGVDPENPPEGLECYPIKNAGPRSSGCPIEANPIYYLYSGDSYRRP